MDFIIYYRWERKILTSIIPVEDIPGLLVPNLPTVDLAHQNAIVKVKMAPEGLLVLLYAVYNNGVGTPENLLDYISALQGELARSKLLSENYDFEEYRD